MRVPVRPLLPALLFAAAAGSASAAEPPPLRTLFEASPSIELQASFAADKRQSAMRAAALAWGSRAALARRSWEIQGILDRHAAPLSATFRFRTLLLERHGFTVQPPILAETARAFRLDDDGARAASAGRVVRILEPARIVSRPPHWSDWLRRSWAEVRPPVSVLFPRTDAEKAAWREWVAEGWTAGTELADDIFADDLEKLLRAFEGMALWRRALLARMVSVPKVTAAHAAVAGHETEMRIRETVAEMAGRARLNLKADEWIPQPEGELP